MSMIFPRNMELRAQSVGLRPSQQQASERSFTL